MKWGNFPASSKDQNKGQLKRSCFRHGKRKSISSGVLSGKWHQPGEYKGMKSAMVCLFGFSRGFFLRWKLSDSFLVYFINYFCKLPLSLIAFKDTKLEDSISFYLRISTLRRGKTIKCPENTVVRPQDPNVYKYLLKWQNCNFKSWPCMRHLSSYNRL